MKPNRKPPKPPVNAAAPKSVPLTTDQARDAIAACLIVLDGAEPAQILKLVDRIQVGKQILRGIVSGQIGIGSPAAKGVAAATPPEKKA